MRGLRWWRRRALERLEHKGFADGVQDVADERARERRAAGLSRLDEPRHGDPTEPVDLNEEERAAYDRGRARGSEKARGR